MEEESHGDWHLVVRDQNGSAAFVLRNDKTGEVYRGSQPGDISEAKAAARRIMIRAMNRPTNPPQAWWVWPAVAFAGTVLVAGIGARLWRWHKGRTSPLASDPGPSRPSRPSGSTPSPSGSSANSESV